MSVENILVSLAENGAQISDVFLRFINQFNHTVSEATVSLVKSEDSEQITQTGH